MKNLIVVLMLCGLCAGQTQVVKHKVTGCSHTDAFTAADGTDLHSYNASWVENLGAFAINTNAVYCSSSPSHAMASWTGCSFTNNQYAQATVAALASDYLGVAVRVQAGADEIGYLARVIGDGTGIEVYKDVSGSYTLLGTYSSTVNVNDVIYLSATGTSTTTITLKVNGTTVGGGPWTDSSSPITGGSPGLYASGATAGTLRLDSWTGSDF